MTAHSLKYADSDVIGILLGNTDQITDVIPLSHLPLNSCFLHSSLDLVLKALKNPNGTNIIGIYDFEESFPIDENKFTLQKTLLANFKTLFQQNKLIYLRLKTDVHQKIAETEIPLKFAQEMSQFMKTSANIFADVYSFENDGLKIVGVQLEVNSRLIEGVIKDNKYLKIMDVDDHLDNPENDFLNQGFA